MRLHVDLRLLLLLYLRLLSAKDITMNNEKIENETQVTEDTLEL
jgi:hypothetical protein